MFWWLGLQDKRMLVRQDLTRVFIDSRQLPVNFSLVLKVWLWAVLKMGGSHACALYPGWGWIEGEPANPVIMPHLDSRSFWYKQMSKVLKRRAADFNQQSSDTESRAFFEHSSVSHSQCLKLQIILYWIWSCFCMLLLLERDLLRTQWAEEHLPGLNWISPLEKPLSAAGMSYKVQVKSGSQWECNSPLRDACISSCACYFTLCSHICNRDVIPFVWLCM